MPSEIQMLWERAVASALLGTDRQAWQIPDRAAADSAQLATVLAGLSAQKGVAAELRLLKTGGVMGLMRQAGQIPHSVKATDNEPALAAQETLQRVGPRAARHFDQLLDGLHREALPEWLAACASARKRIGEMHLPIALDLGRRTRELRPALLPVLGERGVWLAQFNDDWAWARGGVGETVATVTEFWQAAPLAARLELFHQLRRTEPDAARDLMAGTWSTDDADGREAMVAAMAIGLSIRDEVFLEAALEDKGKKVRSAAADLLACLPDSALVRRMIARAETWLLAETPKQGLLSKLTGRKLKVAVQLPEACDAAMQRDGVMLKPPATGAGNEKYGNKSWWLRQVIAAVPPSVWCRRWQATPEVIFAALASTEWQSVLEGALMDAALRFRDLAWCEALLDLRRPPALLEMLPAVKQHAWLLSQIRATSKTAPLDTALLPFLAVSHGPWPEALADRVLEAVRRWIGSQKQDTELWHLFAQLPNLALRMPPTMAVAAAAAWPTGAFDGLQGAKPVENFVSLLHFRMEMLAALQE